MTKYITRKKFSKFPAWTAARTRLRPRTSWLETFCRAATTHTARESTKAVGSSKPEKNRVSAQNTRKRKKLYIDLLEAKVELLEAKVAWR